MLSKTVERKQEIGTYQKTVLSVAAITAFLTFMVLCGIGVFLSLQRRKK